MDPLTLAIGVAVAVGLWRQLERETAHIEPYKPPVPTAEQKAKLEAERKAREAKQKEFDVGLTGWLWLVGVGAVIVGIVLS